ncbi:MAG TPA: L-threonylcarbamoyladenylate synthase [Thermoanaerobaculia bacterium]|nr:L-threonylcarbamoyladenylate synthase [Thermoanaerobaculia bacterium]
MKRWQVAGAPTEAQLDEIAALLRSGGIVLLPTDTIYGLHGLPSESARIATIKYRDEEKRFLLISSSIEQLRSLGIDVPSALNKIWPAPMTAVLRRGGATVAARVPDLKWLRDLLERTGPLISTSANRSGDPPISVTDELRSDLLSAIDGVVDAGRREGKPSAIVDFTETEPRFIREGDPRFAQMLRKTLSKKL